MIKIKKTIKYDCGYTYKVIVDCINLIIIYKKLASIINESNNE